MNLDSLVVTAATLDEGTAYVEDLLSVRLSPGGRHDGAGTHNNLLSLGPDCYLQVVAVDPDAPPPVRPRWFNLDWFRGPPRLSGWFVRVPDVEEAIRYGMEGMSPPQRIARETFAWRISIPRDAMEQEVCCAPAFLELLGAPMPDILPDVGCRLIELQVGHRDPQSLRLPPIERVKLTASEHPGLRAIIATPSGGRLLT
ncbi:VOC family protein [Roseitranquillus sediminis]|uniref:VOC family protein n=1 Tax=Roseitranquillus sediminis TaxID=2809051 RepID=UPI001D0C83DF|nr:VOC family protein [Roseitranquillus sediminis]